MEKIRIGYNIDNNIVVLKIIDLPADKVKRIAPYINRFQGLYGEKYKNPTLERILSRKALLFKLTFENNELAIDYIDKLKSKVKELNIEPAELNLKYDIIE